MNLHEAARTYYSTTLTTERAVSTHNSLMEEIMKLSTWLTINAVVAFLFGLAFLILPDTTLSLYGVQLTPPGVMVSRLLGAAFLGFGIITWMLRNSSGPEVRAVVLALALSELLGFVVSLYYQLKGISNPLGWSTVVIYLLLGAGFAYFYWRNE
jgi:hypothetical protein